MRKILVVGIFLTLVSGLFTGAIYSLVEEHRHSLARYAPSTEEELWKSERMGPVRLSKREVDELVLLWNRELIELERLQWIFTASFFIGVVFIFAILLKRGSMVKKFDGLFLWIITCCMVSVEWVIDVLSDKYYGGRNAIMDLSIGIFVGTIIVLPILFFAAYRMNQHELALKLHRQKWVSYLSITFAVLSLLLALVIGVGVLMTPDLSGNIT